MRPVSDALLLTIAQIAATLVGLLVVGIFFYVENGLRRLSAARPQAASYLRATVKVILALYGLVLVVSLALVALDRPWVIGLFVVIGGYVVVALVEWTPHARNVRRVVRIRGTSPWAAWLLFAVPLALPWILGGWAPDAEAMTWALFVAGGLALVNTLSLLLFSFDLAALDHQVRGSARDDSAGMPSSTPVDSS